MGSQWTSVSVNAFSCQATAQSICPTSSFLYTFSLCWIGMTFVTPLFFFFLRHPLFLYILVSVSSLTSSYFCLSLLFVSYHPSILPAGWPKSCAVLELCSGRDKLSVALCSHTYPLLSQRIDCVHEKETEGRWGWGAKEGEQESDGEKEDKCKEKHREIDWHKNMLMVRSLLKTVVEWIRICSID